MTIHSSTFTALENFAEKIWHYIMVYQETAEIIILSSHSVYDLKRCLIRTKPDHRHDSDISSRLLPRVIGLTEWLLETPGLQNLLPIHSNIQRIEDTYQVLKKQKKQNNFIFNQTEKDRWNLSNNLLYLYNILNHLSLDIFVDLPENFQDIQKKIESRIKRKIINPDLKLLSYILKYSNLINNLTTSVKAAQLRAKFNNQSLKIFVDTTFEHHCINNVYHKTIYHFLQKKKSIEIRYDHKKNALWEECFDASEEYQFQLKKNREFFHQSRSKKKIFMVRNIEEIAYIAISILQNYIKKGHQNIAIINQDRLIIKQIQSLLKCLKFSITVYNEIKEKFSDTKIGFTLIIWINIIQSKNSGPKVIDLIDFLSSPYIDWTVWKISSSKIQIILEFLQNNLIRSEIKTGWNNLFERINEADVSIKNDIKNILQSIQIYQKCWFISSEKRYVDWYQLLIKQWKKLGLYRSFIQDTIGAQLIQKLLQLKYTFDFTDVQSFFEFLKKTCDDYYNITECKKIETSSTIKIYITTLDLACFRHFDAWIIPGCHTKNLLSINLNLVNLKTTLNKKLMNEILRRQIKNINELMTSYAEWAILWNSKGLNQEKLQPPSWLKCLYIHHLCDLYKTWLIPSIPIQIDAVFVPSIAYIESDKLLPTVISPTGYQLFKICPYRYFVEKILKFENQLEFNNTNSTLPGKLIHKILKKFFSLNLDYVTNQKNYLIKILENISFEEFKPFITFNQYWFSTWLIWNKQIPLWIDWQIERNKQGWKVIHTEYLVEFFMHYKTEKIRIRGFIDRIDENQHGQLAILDYKFSTLSKIKEIKKNIANNPQLIIYAMALKEHPLFCNKEITQVAWLSLKDVDQPILLIENLEKTEKKIQEQLCNDIQIFVKNKSFLASSPDYICKNCKIRGVCRKEI